MIKNKDDTDKNDDLDNELSDDERKAIQKELSDIFKEHNEKHGRNFSIEDIGFLDAFEEKYPEHEYDVVREDIGGLESVLNRFETFKLGINHRELYDAMGITPPNGFVLYGAPGTGKTYIAKYLAQDVGARFIDLSLDKFESKWVGDASKALVQVLTELRYRYNITGQKNLLFFDEMEEIYKDRREMGWHGPRVNVLLREMDGLGDNRGIIFAGATNYIEKVDPAALRPGRFDFVIKIEPYNAEQLKDVVMATANRRNRKALHHDPYIINRRDAGVIARFAVKNHLTPAGVAEAFRRAGEEKIQYMVETNEPELNSEKDIYIRKDDILEAMKENRDIKTKPSIGF